MTDEQIIMNFLSAHQLAVISTVNIESLSPESALVAYVEDDDFVLYFQTSKSTRKADNLTANPSVSLVIGHDLEELATLQYEGTAEQIASEEAIKTCKTKFLAKKSPSTPDYIEKPGVQFYRVTPTWLRLYRAHSRSVIELDF